MRKSHHLALFTFLLASLAASLTACTKHVRLDQDRESASQGIQFH